MAKSKEEGSLQDLHFLGVDNNLTSSINGLAERTVEESAPLTGRFTIVVFLGESSGKSSAPNRLPLLPIFPTDSKMCTLLTIHVHFKSDSVMKLAKVEVHEFDGEDSHVIGTKKAALSNSNQGIGEMLKEAVAEHDSQSATR